jgi:hypothetical protein
LLEELKSDRSFSISGVEPVLHLDVVDDFSDEPLSPLLPLFRGCVAAAVLGMTTCTTSHSKASWFSWLLAFFDELDGGVCSLIHSLISVRTVAL